MRPIDIVKQATGMKLQDRKGRVTELKLLPPLTAEEVRTLESSLPCPLPSEARELFAYARGFEGEFGDVVAEVDLSGGSADGQVMDWLFPHGIPIARDWFGNSWNVDLVSDSASWGPIFYLCHDPPVTVFQTDSLARFISEILRLGNPPWESELVTSHNEQIWGRDPNVISYEQCLQSGDADLEAFAGLLDETWLFVDLRNPRLGDGFSWGRFPGEPQETNRRFGEKRVFAYQQRTSRSLWQRLHGR